MAAKSWADRSDFEGEPARPVRCPCCGQLVAADMILELPGGLAAERRAEIAQELGRPVGQYVCTGWLAQLHRRGLGQGLPGSL